MVSNQCTVIDIADWQRAVVDNKTQATCPPSMLVQFNDSGSGELVRMVVDPWNTVTERRIIMSFCYIISEMLYFII